ncbi:MULTISPECIES: transporter [unclassified Corynebacterium]|uniref:transporter n=1 Tax=unclassified Corynebacterium TaxID=2624378 RepID=UPI0021AA8ED9|nr:MULTISPECIES: transporter [unclassified Corynebacterium]MCT1451852.1 transporter [Corynebacterium sp. p3-SID1145]MCT1460949.1 transporter [Corynebacterium sp. p3-SID1140]MDN8594213.1 transporter [Corynebacterium sp. P4_F2]WKK55233.1 transporter [Corynebacterium sp. P4-C1]WKK62643.1 transporter [Corynebacterium sp. P8-C1]
MTKNYRFEGPTDETSVARLKDEVGQVLGTQGVKVEVEEGILRVRGENFTDDQISLAVEYAGFSLIDE